MSSQTTNEPTNCVYVIPVSLESAKPCLMSVADLTMDHNIVLNMGPQSETESDLHQMIDMSPLHHMGTWSWMSAELVMTGAGQPVVHDLLHDLESLFYVLVSICILLNSPSKPKCDKDLAQCFDKYFNTFELSVFRTITIQSDITWKPFIMHHISEYFEPVIHLLTCLHDAIIIPLFFDNHRNIHHRQPFTHDLFIANIIDMLSHLGLDTSIPMGQENSSNSDYSTLDVKVEDELALAGVAKEVQAFIVWAPASLFVTQLGRSQTMHFCISTGIHLLMVNFQHTMLQAHHPVAPSQTPFFMIEEDTALALYSDGECIMWGTMVSALHMIEVTSEGFK
ncbi:hypothetical protein EDC04DRAFT_2616987 [Pisolithus marmoratus]|nr:hypothetical protein EDC04DRAFT_2616987 [Pisolithus marmoratus]